MKSFIGMLLACVAYRDAHHRGCAVYGCYGGRPKGRE